MENKSDEATHQRPQGERLLSADFVQMDLNRFVQHLKEEPTWRESDRNSITIFKSDSMRILLLGLHKSAELKEHQAKAVISVQGLEGTVNFITGQKIVTLEKGQMVALQKNIPHSVVALTQAFFLLTLAMNTNALK